MAENELGEIVGRLAAAFRSAVPLPGELMAKGRRRPSEQDIQKRVEAGLLHFHKVARQERKRTRLGIYRRAKVAFELQQQLLDAGYSPALVKQVLFSMLVSSFTGR